MYASLQLFFFLVMDTQFSYMAMVARALQRCVDWLQAYALQDKGLDTITANHALGFEADYRDFSLPGAILNDLGIRRVRLLSNNPEKSEALAKAGIDVVEQIPCEVSPNSHAARYLRTKKERMGHSLSLV